MSKDKNSGTNPVLAIAIAILVAALTAGACLISYWRSDARKIVELTQRPVTNGIVSADIDTTSVVGSADLDATEQAISGDLSPLKPANDYNANLLTDAALGL